MIATCQQRSDCCETDARDLADDQNWRWCAKCGAIAIPVISNDEYVLLPCIRCGLPLMILPQCFSFVWCKSCGRLRYTDIRGEAVCLVPENSK